MFSDGVQKARGAGEPGNNPERAARVGAQKRYSKIPFAIYQELGFPEERTHACPSSRWSVTSITRKMRPLPLRFAKKRITIAQSAKNPLEGQVKKRDGHAAAMKAWRKRRAMTAFAKVRAAEAASKEALRLYCQKYGWKLAFFEGATGAPRTGIIDAIAFRLGRHNADFLDVRLIQLKGGGAGVSGREIARLKQATQKAAVGWLIAAYDGEGLHLIPDDLMGNP